MLRLNFGGVTNQSRINYEDMYKVIVNRKKPKTLAGCIVAAIFRLKTVNMMHVSKVYARINEFDKSQMYNKNYIHTFLIDSLAVVPEIFLTSNPYPKLVTAKLPLAVDLNSFNIIDYNGHPNQVFEKELFDGPSVFKYDGDVRKYVINNLKIIKNKNRNQEYILNQLTENADIDYDSLTSVLISDLVPIAKLELCDNNNNNLLKMKFPKSNSNVLIPESILNVMRDICSYHAINNYINNVDLTYIELIELLNIDELQIKALTLLILRVRYGSSIKLGNEFYEIPPTSSLISVILESKKCKQVINFPISVKCANIAMAMSLIKEIAAYSINELTAAIHCSSFRIPSCMLYDLYGMCTSNAERFIVLTFFIMDGGALSVSRERNRLKPVFGSIKYDKLNLIDRFPDFVRTPSYLNTNESYIEYTSENNQSVMSLCYSNGCSFTLSFTEELDFRLPEIEMYGKCDLNPIELAHFIIGYSTL